MTRLLITGATGLLGHVASLDWRHGFKVHALVHRRPLAIPEVIAVEGDLMDPASLEQAWAQARPDVVVHAAALASIEACEAEPVLAQQINVEATKRVATLCAERDAILLHISTDAVFDGRNGPYVEKDPTGPRSVYARTKLDAERVCLATHPGALVVRTNFFGWSSSGRRSIAEFFYNSLVADQQVAGFTDVEFTPLYHRDLLAILQEAIQRRLQGIYHVGSADRMTKYSFGRAVAKTFGLDENLVRPQTLDKLDQSGLRSPRLSLDSTKLADALGSVLPTVDVGLRRMRADLDSGYTAALGRN